jgi:hypothetical protein
VAGIANKALFEVVADLALALHPEIGFGPARVAAIFLFGRPLQDRHPGARVTGGDRRRQPSNAASDHQDVEDVCGLFNVRHMILLDS